MKKEVGRELRRPLGVLRKDPSEEKSDRYKRGPVRIGVDTEVTGYTTTEDLDRV